ncbi:restriction endonuclease subunit S [Brachyspira sp.]|uniref:restriction endonuclease subunit S n=1 Tax=Brachyspira sp. TaxID=1977261 RepID=UPI002636E892|nr:restriction endonuclease subunit S [Brachyspira sp.]
MKKNKLVPKLRFPEFKNSPSWDIKKFDFQFLPTNTFSRSEMNNNKGIVKNIHYGDILTKYNYIVDKTSLIPFINDDINLNKFTRESYLKSGDIIIADTAEDFSAGKSIEVQNINCKVLSGQHTFLCRPQIKYAPKFLGYYLNSPLYHNHLTKFLTGTKVYSITKTNIKNTFIIYPDNLEEQQKIADCLASIDELVDAEKRKLEALKKYKKALMQKLFPSEDASIPELRFAEFRINIDFFNGNLLFEQISNKNNNSDLPILAITQNKGAIPRNEINYNVVATEKSISTYKVVEVGDFIISLRSFQGGIEYSNYKGICSPAYIILRKKNNNIYEPYYKYYFKTDRYIINLNANIEGIRDGKMISYSQFSDIKIPCPTLEEQQKIADCLASIDSIIDSQVKRIDNLIKHKKALMQGLFPDMESIEDYE